MSRKLLFLPVLILIAILAIAACGGDTPESADTPVPPAPTTAPAPTDAPEPTPVPAPTDRPEPTPQPAEPAADTETSPLPTPKTFSLRAFDIDAENSEVRYEAEEDFLNGAVERLGKALGYFNAIGVTNAIAGGLVFVDGDPPSIETSQFEVDLSTLKSDDDRRDQRLREKYLESNAFPMAQFQATGVENFPQSYEVGETISFLLLGDMTIHETTSPAVWEVTATMDGNSISGTAQTVVVLADYDIEVPVIPGILTVTDGIKVVVEFKADEAAP